MVLGLSFCTLDAQTSAQAACCMTVLLWLKTVQTNHSMPGKPGGWGRRTGNEECWMYYASNSLTPLNTGY